MSVKLNLLKNGLASILQKGIRVLEQLLLVPFFITAWGADYYGEWLTLTIIPSILAFSDFGFGTAAANSFVLSYAGKKFQKAANINKTGILIISLMIIIAIIVSLVVLFLCYHFHFFDNSLINTNDAIIAVSILCLARFLNFYTQLFESYYRAAQKASVSINLLTLKAVLNISAGLIILLMNYGVVAFSISQLIVIIGFNLFFAIKGKSMLNIFDNHKGLIDRHEIKEITQKGIGYLISPMWQAIYFQGSTLIIRVILGPEAVTIFNTLRTLSRSLNQVFYLVKGTVFPELQYKIGQEEWNHAKKLYRISVFGVFLMSIIGFFVLAIGGLWFYNIWTKNTFMIPTSLWYIFISGIIFNALWWTAEMIFAAINKPNKIAIYGLSTAIISTGLTYILTLRFGINGSAIGYIALDVMMAAITLPLAANTLKMGTFDFIIHGLKDFKLILIQGRKKFNSITSN